MRKIAQFIFFLGTQLVLAQSSVLSEGNWFKLGVTETGIYKINKTALDILGVSGNINPTAIQLYGNGYKGILPQSNATIRPVDLIENAIQMEAGNDGSFDDEDYFLFYGITPNIERWTENGFEYKKNIYSDTAYYFLRVDGVEGKRIESQPSQSGTATTSVTSFDDFITFEEDKQNRISSGRIWYGETLSSGESKYFSHQIDGLNSNLNITLSAINQSSQNATFDIFSQNTPIGSIAIPEVPAGTENFYRLRALQKTETFTFSSSTSFDLNIRFDGNLLGQKGYIDFYFLTFQRNLSLYTNETAFRWIGNLGELLRYEIGNASGSFIWNVTDPTNVFEQKFDMIENKAVFQNATDSIEEYVVFEGNDFPIPFIFGKIPNQNLRGSTNFDGIILTHPAFVIEAERLAQFHRNHDNLLVHVVTTEQVYNEFSSGRQDLTAIRDYAKYVYENGGRLQYLTLFGDCSYDYKHRIRNNKNFVPTYESRESYHPIYSYSSDDYYGFLEPDEGEWIENEQGDHDMEIGVGRLPVKTRSEARGVVDKIIHYSTSSKTLGKWRTDVTYVADDGDRNTHADHVERLSEIIDTSYSNYNVNKMLLDAFFQEGSGSTERSPAALSALETRIKKGTFLVNFYGHGNENLWTDEQILTRRVIEELTNRDRLPIFVTATCEFGKYDSPVQDSGAERLLLLEQGGAIALLTTSRPVFANTNFTLNQAFHENIFRKEAGKHLRLGDIIKHTKNESLEGPVNRNFTLLGDPMMMPSYPKLAIVLKDMETTIDTLSALEKIVLSGEIRENEALKSNFNGTLAIRIFDSKQVVTTKGQEKSPYLYTTRTNAFFRGEASVKNGKFIFDFVVPKNISYQYKKGKISLYAWDEDLNIDAIGSSDEFVIGGTNPDPIRDETPPRMQVYMNNPSFINGGKVGNSPLLIAKITDESGITSVRSGVLEGITLLFQGETFNLNEFYLADLDDYSSGTIIYPIQNLDPGTYQATLEVLDTYNNRTETIIEFVVSEEATLFIYNPIVFPNPIESEAIFSFEHDREDEDLLINLVIYGSHGNVVNRTKYTITNSNRSIQLPWKAETTGGEALTQGIYYARIIINSRIDGAINEIIQKLVIVN